MKGMANWRPLTDSLSAESDISQRVETKTKRTRIWRGSEMSPETFQIHFFWLVTAPFWIAFAWRLRWLMKEWIIPFFS